MRNAQAINAYFGFLVEIRERLRDEKVSAGAEEVTVMRESVEEHYADDQGKPAMYQRFESALYDDAPALVTLWNCFDAYDRDDLRSFQRLTKLEIDGLTGDRHPRKVFDRSPFGVVALVIGTVTIWMTVLSTYSGKDLGLIEGVRFESIVGVIWIVGLFVVVWYIFKTHRNNIQVAFLSSLARALDLYLDEETGSQLAR